MAKRILVVDALELYHRYAERLAELGYDAHLAISGEDAIEQLNRGTYDAVIIARQIGYMRQFDLYKYAQHRRTGCPVMMLTDITGYVRIEWEVFISDRFDAICRMLAVWFGIPPAGTGHV